MFKTNVLGALRTARAFIGLLRPTRGRLIYFGACNPGDGLVAFTASRVAVEGCVDALRTELHSYGISVIALDSHGVPAETMFRAPMPYSNTKHSNCSPFGRENIHFSLIYRPLGGDWLADAVLGRSADAKRTRSHRERAVGPSAGGALPISSAELQIPRTQNDLPQLVPRPEAHANAPERHSSLASQVVAIYFHLRNTRAKLSKSTRIPFVHNTFTHFDRARLGSLRTNRRNIGRLGARRT